VLELLWRFLASWGERMLHRNRPWQWCTGSVSKHFRLEKGNNSRSVRTRHLGWLFTRGGPPPPLMPTFSNYTQLCNPLLTDVKYALGKSSPAKPILHEYDPTSPTIAPTSSASKERSLCDVGVATLNSFTGKNRRHSYQPSCLHV